MPSKEEIDNLLIEFEEMGFCPAPFNRNAQAYACQWRDKIRNAIIKDLEVLDILKKYIRAGQWSNEYTLLSWEMKSRELKKIKEWFENE